MLTTQLTENKDKVVKSMIYAVLELQLFNAYIVDLRQSIKFLVKTKIIKEYENAVESAVLETIIIIIINDRETLEYFRFEDKRL